MTVDVDDGVFEARDHHGLRIAAPTRRESHRRWLGVLAAAAMLLVLAGPVEQRLLAFGVLALVAWFVPDRRATVLELRPDTLTVQRARLGRPERLVALWEDVEFAAVRHPTRVLTVEVGGVTVPIAWDGSQESLDQAVAALEEAQRRYRPDDVPDPPANLQHLRAPEGA